MHLYGVKIRPLLSQGKLCINCQPLWPKHHLNFITSVAPISGLRRTSESSYRIRVLRISCNEGNIDVLQRSEIKSQGSDEVANELTYVMKFGGLSVPSAERMREVAELILSFLEERPVIVLSTMGKITNKLLLAKEKAVNCSVFNVSDIDELTILKELHLRTAIELGIERSIILCEFLYHHAWNRKVHHFM